MRFIPIEITQDNLQWAVNENIRRIEETLRRKALIEHSRPMLNINARGKRIGGAVSVDETDACTLDKFLAIKNGNA